MGVVAVGERVEVPTALVVVLAGGKVVVTTTALVVVTLVVVVLITVVGFIVVIVTPVVIVGVVMPTIVLESTFGVVVAGVLKVQFEQFEDVLLMGASVVVKPVVLLEITPDEVVVDPLEVTSTV